MEKEYLPAIAPIKLFCSTGNGNLTRKGCGLRMDGWCYVDGNSNHLIRIELLSDIDPALELLVTCGGCSMVLYGIYTTADVSIFTTPGSP